MILAGSETPNERASAALQVGDDSAAGLNQFVWLDPEHVVPRSRGRPHLVVLQQIWVDEDAQLSRVAERRYATPGFGNPSD